MYSKILSAGAVVLASSSLASAQTFSSCNPVKGDSEFGIPRGKEKPKPEQQR
jgi:hypothetical protein